MLMKNIFIILACLYLNVTAQDIWTNRTEDTFQLNTKALTEQLQSLITGENDFVLITFPTPRKGLAEFKISLNEALSPSLQKKFPYIHSFNGTSLDGHTSLALTCNKDYFTINLLQDHKPWNLVYKKNNVYRLVQESSVSSRGFNCNTHQKQSKAQNQSKNLELQRIYTPNFIPDNQIRVIRFAVVVTGETSDYFINKAESQGAILNTISEKKAAVITGIASSINIINPVFVRDIGVRLQLIESDNLIFLDENTDPFSDINTSNEITLINQASDYITNTIGSDNFDLGHLLATVRNGARGLAEIGSLCGNSKANAITASNTPEGFNFAFTLFAHEIGHQLGGNHTQNANCQRNFNTAVEVSSGTTIMGYSGACGALDVQDFSDDYFHSVSIDEILNTFQDRESRFDCTINKEVITNNLPTIQIASNQYHIPINTPFFLDAIVTDADNDILSYSWEQLDSDIGSSPPEADNPLGPLFRVFNPSLNSRRDFPSNSLLNQLFNSEFEVLPNVERNMTFNLLVRDNKPQGIAYSSPVIVNAVGEEAFTISLPKDTDDNELSMFSVKELVNLKWNVGNTNGSVINTSNVSIDLINTSTGLQTNLLDSTPNDGNETIEVPLDFIGENFKFKVNAIDNIFYNVSNPFEITVATNTNISISSSQDKLSNHLVFKTKIKEPLLENTEIILAFINEISNEVLSLTTINSEISFDGGNYQALSNTTINESDFNNFFSIRIPLDLTLNGQALEK